MKMFTESNIYLPLCGNNIFPHNEEHGRHFCLYLEILLSQEYHKIYFSSI